MNIRKLINGWTVGTVLTYLLLSMVYGDVFVRAQQEAPFSFDSEVISFLLAKPFGYFLAFGRALLITYKVKWIGAIMLTAIVSATAILFDKTLRVAPSLRGLSFVVALMPMFYFMLEGLYVYYTQDAGRVFLYPILLLIIALISFLISKRLPLKYELSVSSFRFSQYAGIAIVVMCIFGMSVYAYLYQQNTVIVARQQMMMLNEDWSGMINEALKSKRVDRCVAAYHAIGCERKSELLQRLFEIDYDYPESLRTIVEHPREESYLYLPDCALHAGLFNNAYHTAMENMVLYGTSTYLLKEMVILCVASEDWKLAEKYLKILENIVCEGAFVAKWQQMIDNHALAVNNSLIAQLRKYNHRVESYESNFKNPFFLSFNVELQPCNDAQLVTAIAADLYAKNISTMMNHVIEYSRRFHILPQFLNQAIVLAGALYDTRILEVFPEVRNAAGGQIQAFLTDAKPFLGNPDAMREALKSKWYNTYMYYFYCGNRSGATQKTVKNDGIN